EGNAPADVHKNALLHRLLRSQEGSPLPRSLQAWLGEALAIKDPTAAVFRRQSGSNLLLIGQQEEAALGMLATAVIALSAQVPNSGIRFLVLDGTPLDSPHAGIFAKLATVVPHSLQVISWRGIPQLMATLTEEIDRRQKESQVDAKPVFVVIHGLHRFRDLRRNEDDFGYSSRADEAPRPSRALATMLREGSGLGVHVMIWCDTLNNLNRFFDRQALREFDQRVLFQMSAADSSNLIDTPQASKLGLHRALFFSEDRGQAEKF